MIVVIDNSYARKPGESAPPLRPPAGRSPGSFRIVISPTFGEVVIKDLLPALDKRYRALADREHRAIAGLSMGAAFAMQIGLGNLDTFSHFGSFSGTVMRDLDVKTSYGGVLSNAAEFNKKCRLLFIAAGTAEQSRLDAARHARAELDKVGVKYVAYDSPGTDHEWLTLWRWRDDFQNDFAARMDWTIKSFSEANHPPVAKVNHPEEFSVKSGEWFRLDADGSTDPDGDSLSYFWFQYAEVGTYKERVSFGPFAPNLYNVHTIRAPDVDQPQTVHFILKVTDKGTPPLTRYKRVIVTILPK